MRFLPSSMRGKRVKPKEIFEESAGTVVFHRGRTKTEYLLLYGHDPRNPYWGMPKGIIEPGEDRLSAAKRETKEETGLEVEPLECILVFDRIMREGERVKYHFVIVDYLCRRKRGRLRPASDVIDARWVRREDLPRYHLTDLATKLIGRAFELMDRRK